MTTVRDAFEVWAASDNRVIQPLEFEDRSDDNNHYYESDGDNNAFIGWKARASLQPATPTAAQRAMQYHYGTPDRYVSNTPPAADAVAGDAKELADALEASGNATGGAVMLDELAAALRSDVVAGDAKGPSDCAEYMLLQARQKGQEQWTNIYAAQLGQFVGYGCEVRATAIRSDAAGGEKTNLSRKMQSGGPGRTVPDAAGGVTGAATPPARATPEMMKAAYAAYENGDIIAYADDWLEAVVNAALGVAQAAPDLLKYANHLNDCRYRGGHDCDCGLDEIRAASKSEAGK